MCSDLKLLELTVENFNKQYKQNIVRLDEIMNKNLLADIELEFGIIYCYDFIHSDYIEKLNLEVEKIIEARFFNDKEEIRVSFNNNNLRGNIVIEGSPNYYKESYLLYPRSKDRKFQYPNKLDVKKYISYDPEDNQAYIEYVKPAKLVFKEVRHVR